jgi:hypothetical protein
MALGGNTTSTTVLMARNGPHDQSIRVHIPPISTTYLGLVPMDGDTNGEVQGEVQAQSSRIQTFGQRITAWKMLTTTKDVKQLRRWTKIWKIMMVRTLEGKNQIGSPRSLDDIWGKIPNRIKFWVHMQYMRWTWDNLQYQWYNNIGSLVSPAAKSVIKPFLHSFFASSPVKFCGQILKISIPTLNSVTKHRGERSCSNDQGPNS